MKDFNQFFLLFIFSFLSKCKTECPPFCQLCSGSSYICQSCIPGYYLNSTTNTCNKLKAKCKTCLNKRDSASCQSGFFSCSNACCKCNVNCKKTSDNCRCNDCNEGYYLSDFMCLSCNSNCKNCLGKDTGCLSCYVGFYLNNDKSCLKCISQCRTCSSEKICISCIDNYFMSSYKCYQCNINCRTTNDNCKCDS